MPLEIKITYEDIRYAEKVLLPEGKTFDPERKNFICDFKTLDLQAVPGSGKTTALLAKLLILEKKLPLYDGSGILVISHTNAAINEIKNKIQKHCPKLFSYPNFVGTIQSFVDEFLAIPLYRQIFKTKLNWIDTDRYEEELFKLFDLIAWDKDYDQPTKWFYQRHITRATVESKGNGTLTKRICNQLIRDEVGGLYYDFISNEIKNREHKVVLKNNTNKKYLGLKDIIFKVLRNGIISYDYAYHLGEYYIYLIPIIKEIIQKRFSFVFVDEMQDMDSHQYNLLENIFYDEGNSCSVFQRIGDKNQAIFNYVKAEDVWTDRETVLRINGSQRLSKPIARVVKKFALFADEEFDIEGLNECTIKPHILVFDNTTINQIIPSFAKIVKVNKENGNLVDTKNLIKVICWNTEWNKLEDIEDVSKLRLTDYYNTYRKIKSKPKQDYPCLKSYLLFYDKSRKTLGSIKKNIVGAFLKILRLENINTADGRPYTSNKLLEYILLKDITKYDQINLYIFNWAINIVKGKINDVWNEMIDYSPSFLSVFSDNPLDKSLAFINDDLSEIPAVDCSEHGTTNYYTEDGLKIEVTSVHATKGQTHSATLYLESFFDRGYGNYESERLRNQFLGTQKVQETLVTIENSFDKVIQSAKMVYVGFSRPTSLLCVAIHKSRIDEYLSKISRDDWEVVEVEASE